MKASHSCAVACSTSVEVGWNGTRRGPGRSQCSKVPGSPRQPVKAPLTRRSTVGGPGSAGMVELPEQDRVIGAGRLALDLAPVVERDGELDGGVAGELAVDVGVAPVDRQEGPVLVVPAQAGLADPAVDLGLDVDAEDRLDRLGAVVDDPEPLDILAGGLGPAGRPGEARALGDEVGGGPGSAHAARSARSSGGSWPPGSAGRPPRPAARRTSRAGGRAARPATIDRKCDRLWGSSPSAGRTSEWRPTVGK